MKRRRAYQREKRKGRSVELGILTVGTMSGKERELADMMARG